MALNMAHRAKILAPNENILARAAWLSMRFPHTSPVNIVKRSFALRAKQA
jgi:hypothetical protein